MKTNILTIMFAMAFLLLDSIKSANCPGDKAHACVQGCHFRKWKYSYCSANIFGMNVTCYCDGGKFNL